jgi:enoyl-[acyl-carrier-protein] reductase (NADH)
MNQQAEVKKDKEVARLALVLAGDESTFCTGSIHMIDGGFTAA